jgi:hypothetical protein
MQRPKHPKHNGTMAEVESLCSMVDDLDLLETIKANVLPQIQIDLKKGLTAKQILEKYQAYAAAVTVTNMTDPRNSVASAKEILDRTVGKPSEKKEVTHKYGALTDDELDALLKSRFDDQ